jgi:transposase
MAAAVGIRGTAGAIGTPGAVGIVDAVRLEGASSSEGIERGIRIVRIRAQLAEIFRMDGERQKQEQKKEDNPHGQPPTSGTTSGLSLLPGWKTAQAGNLGTVVERVDDSGRNAMEIGARKDQFYLLARVLLDK